MLTPPDVFKVDIFVYRIDLKNRGRRRCSIERNRRKMVACANISTESWGDCWGFHSLFSTMVYCFTKPAVLNLDHVMSLALNCFIIEVGNPCLVPRNHNVDSRVWRFYCYSIFGGFIINHIVPHSHKISKMEVDKDVHSHSQDFLIPH